MDQDGPLRPQVHLSKVHSFRVQCDPADLPSLLVLNPHQLTELLRMMQIVDSPQACGAMSPKARGKIMQTWLA